MTLKKQLFISIALIFIVLLTGSLLVNLKNAQQSLQEQLALHAEETATSLAFSLSTAARDGQSVLMERMVDVIFDSGYYLEIRFVNLKGELLVERERPISVEGVPAWFVKMFDIPSAQGIAEVISGWQRLGTLTVVTNPGLAYRDLWRVLGEQATLFSIVALFAYLLADLALRMLLRPLREVEKQAEAICQKQFIQQERLPRTRELRRVVIAINQMARKLKEIFAEQVQLIEGLRVKSYTDSVTGLSNRNDFDARLQAVIDRGEKRSGLMLLLQITNFIEFNQQHGRTAGDEALQLLAIKLQETFSECADAIFGRRSGADFSVYLPSFSLERGKLLSARYLHEIAEAGFLREATLHIGIAYTNNLTAEQVLLNKADLALRQAQSRGAYEWHLYNDEDLIQVARQAHQWFILLQRILEQKLITLHGQPLFDRQSKKVATEILCRVEDGSQLMNAGVFFPMVERFSLSVGFDQMILAKAAAEHKEENSFVSINLSPQTIRSKDFSAWVEAFLQKNSNLAKHLVLEIPAQMVMAAEQDIRILCDLIKPYGTRLSLDHFGVHSSVFSYLHSLPLQYLKIDRTFIKDIHKNPDHQFFVKSLAQISHGCDVKIYAEGVETEEEWNMVLSLGLDGAQGYYLGRPSPL